MAVIGRTEQITPEIHWVGIEDWQRRLFDALIPLPYGTTYNAYLVKGQDKVALIDTVNPGFEQQLLANIGRLVRPDSLDYVVMNHAEPDHASSIQAVMAAAPKAKLVATAKGAELAGLYFNVPEERRLVVKSGDTIDLGGKTLSFVEAPWLHWPETMFTFAVEDGVLFSCDFFGAHLTSGKLFADEIDGIVLPQARNYFGEIMMPYNKMAVAGLDKAKALNPSVIAPSHGPVHRRPTVILDAYEEWTRGDLKPKVVIAYVSMWGSTRRLAEAVANSVSGEGVEAVIHDLVVADASHVAGDLVDASALMLGSPTVVAGLHPLASHALSLLKLVKPRLKLVAFFGSYGWGGGAGAQAKSVLEPLRFELVDALEIKGPPREAEIESAAELGRKVATRVKESLTVKAGV